MKHYFRYLSKLTPVFFVFIFALTLTQFFGTGGFLGQDVEAKIIQEKGVFDEESVAFDKANPHIQTAMNVQDRHTGVLMSQPGIVGVGTGLNEHGRPAVLVFAESFELARGAFIPSNIEGVPVIVRITGKIVAMPRGGNGGGRGGSGGDSGESFDRTARHRPAPIGVSTGHPAITAGTIGCRVTDGNYVYALSNNHVYADENSASTGDAVLQPGTYDGGTSPVDNIGTLSAFEPINFGGNNVIDAAIASSSTDELGKSTPSDGYGTPKSTTKAPAVNASVKKYGRTTGLTKGKIYAINATLEIGYSTGDAIFEKQIIITPGGFSAPGDSGSLIVIDGKGKDKAHDRKPVGLLFAGSSLVTIANPIDEVLSRFGVTIDGE